MANPHRVPLTTGQGVSAVVAGIVGHLLYSLALFTLVVGLVGLIARAALFAWIDGIVEQIELTGDGGAALLDLLETVRGVLNTIGLVLVISSAVSILIAFLISGAIMKAGGVRKPFGATFAALLIVTVLDLGLFWVYLFIGLTASEEIGFLPTYPIAWTVGTVVLGALVWLWMAHIRRPTVDEVSVAPATAAVEPPAGPAPASP